MFSNSSEPDQNRRGSIQEFFNRRSSRNIKVDGPVGSRGRDLGSNPDPTDISNVLDEGLQVYSMTPTSDHSLAISNLVGVSG